MEGQGSSQLQQSPSLDHIDDLFDYDVGLDDVLQEAPSKSNVNAPKPAAANDGSGLGLGLDEEVKVTKKRQPVAKLDENRLLSQRGIPKLRHAAKAKLKFKGKGHEFSDAARLLNFYQLWLDDLFPRAKFADGLTMIEKLGHSKRIQTMRREWIDEEKPRVQGDGNDAQRGNNATTDGSNNEMSANTEGAQLPNEDIDIMGDTARMSENTQTQRKVGDEDGTNEGLFMSDDDDVAQQPLGHTAPEEDELDALLREQEGEEDVTNKTTAVSDTQLPANDNRGDEDGDELQAMNEMGGYRSIFN